MNSSDEPRPSLAWARFRFSVVGPLLAVKLSRGELHGELLRLSEKLWRHPITGQPFRLAHSTVERWYYLARSHPKDPIGALAKTIRSDRGHFKRLTPALRALIGTQYRDHKSWSYQLHYDNLEALARTANGLESLPSYSTVRRFMKRSGLLRVRRSKLPDTPGGRLAAQHLATFEIRGYEAEAAGALWHADFHEGSRSVLTSAGVWVKPMLLGILDDHSRLACHLQWYTDETAETLVHGLSQAFQKRDLPAALMTDNGAAMKAAETRRGLELLGVMHELTLPHSPYQNAKQESFWGQIEGRLLPMLEGERELTLELLNEATSAWVEFEYNRKAHDELGMSPLVRYLGAPSVARACPDGEHLSQVFRAEAVRKQRRSDGTLTCAGRRYEVPSRYRHLERLLVSYARWDLSWLLLLDDATGAVIDRLYPLDRAANSDGRRRRLVAGREELAAESAPTASGIAPLLRLLMDEQARSGLPPAYLPKKPRLAQAEDTTLEELERDTTACDNFETVLFQPKGQNQS